MSLGGILWANHSHSLSKTLHFLFFIFLVCNVASYDNNIRWFCIILWKCHKTLKILLEALSSCTWNIISMAFELYLNSNIRQTAYLYMHCGSKVNMQLMYRFWRIMLKQGLYFRILCVSSSLFMFQYLVLVVKGWIGKLWWKLVTNSWSSTFKTKSIMKW